ncbi:hypothetical protein PIROE2DRAFT_6150 [Piromyces sp. E2]|nr:hypothetical protein PIROE2DRAFT_6150 [Piromyces sp. E2]|eukprot:OUM66619.1 hypothetical protein PIROE2DRAFT_6150 [Piromyces sp. E2]
MRFKNLLRGIILMTSLFLFPRVNALDECEDFKYFMEREGVNYDISVERCITNNPGKLNEITMHELTFTQDIINKISTYKDLYDM